MEKEIATILNRISIKNKKLITKMQKLVLGVTPDLDAFFKNDKEGVILLASIYRYLATKNTNGHNPDGHSRDMSMEKEEGTLFADFARQDKIIEFGDAIKKVILDIFGVKIDYFEKNASGGIYFSIPY